MSRRASQPPLEPEPEPEEHEEEEDVGDENDELEAEGEMEGGDEEHGAADFEMSDEKSSTRPATPRDGTVEFEVMR
jgi:hypothetical protein